MATKKTELFDLLPASTEELQVYLPDVEASPYQARDMDEQAQEVLAASLQQDGQLEPVRLRRVGDRFEVISGHRRIDAARRLAWTSIRALVYEVGETDALRMLLVDNLQRKDLSPLDEARQFNAALLQLGWSAKTIAKAAGRSESYVRQRLGLLDLSSEAQASIAEAKLTPAQARLAESLRVVPGLFEPTLEELYKHAPLRDEEVRSYVQRLFRERTVPLDDKTPFAWKEVLPGEAIGSDLDGNPVCVDPALYVRIVAEMHGDAMKAAVEAFLAAKKKDIVEGLPVYYDLAGIAPIRGMTLPVVEQFPACPVRVGQSTYENAPALVWDVHLPLIHDKDACRTCPAWGGQGPGRALLVKPPEARNFLGKTVGAQVTLVCMDEPCRNEKQAAGRTVQEQREQKRKDEVEAAQVDLQAQVDAAVKLLVNDRVRLLAVLMVERFSVNKPPDVQTAFSNALVQLGAKLPEIGGHDGLVRSLMALGEEKLIEATALAVISRLDGARDWNAKWVPRKLEATLRLVLGDKLLEEALKASVHGQQGRRTSQRKGATDRVVRWQAARRA